MSKIENWEFNQLKDSSNRDVQKLVNSIKNNIEYEFIKQYQ